MIRLAKEKDLDQVNIIRKQVKVLHTKGEPKIFKSGFPKNLKNYANEFVGSKKKFIIVSENNGIIDGYAMIILTCKKENIYRFEQKFVNIDDFGVLKNEQHKGIGTKIIAYIKKFAKKHGYNRLELNAWAFNKNALDFYEKMGFDVSRVYFKMDLTEE